VLALAALIVFAHLAWLVNISALVTDVVPRASLGAVFGVVAAGSSLGGMMMNKFVASLAEQHAYGLWFLAAATLHPVAWLLLKSFLRPRDVPLAVPS
jgi:ACS family hexuronate transporter-like MFS transporter